MEQEDPSTRRYLYINIPKALLDILVKPYVEGIHIGKEKKNPSNISSLCNTHNSCPIIDKNAATSLRNFTVTPITS